MSTKIKILPEDIANKISAGEVVQRPASVVKELVENSLDAKSTKIVIEIVNAGKNLIRVSDNGEGMSREDAVLAFERFATSKISTASDLDAINSFGFRGEALPSIAAVSYVKLITRTREDMSGTLVKIEGGKIKEVSEVGAAIGTVVEVQNLFFNTPARKKFLKTNITEAAHIYNVVYQHAISHPQVSFKLVHNNQQIINVSASCNFKERILHFLGKELAEDVIPIEFKSDLIEVNGFLSKPSHTRKDKNAQLIFVNQRPVVNKTITHAIYQGYHTLIPKDKHPIVIIFIKIPPKEVDVNVHPTKREIRFRSEEQIHNLIVQAIRKTLSDANLIRKVTISHQIPASSPKESMIKPAPIQQHEIPLPSPAIIPQQKITPPPSPTLSSLKFDSEIQSIGQVFNSYIIAQSKEEIFIIDQHAAHERVLYEKLMKESHDELSLPTQILLIPITLETNYKETAILIENLPVFNSLGFEIEEFGQNSFIIRSVPTVLGKSDPKELIFELIYELQFTGKNKTPQEIREKLLISISCHSAVKAGDKLSQEEIESLISQLSQTQLPFTCPHGRPAIIKMSINELEKRFMRV